MSALADLYALPREYLDFRDTIRQIAQEQVAPGPAVIDEHAEYPHEIRALLAEQDIQVKLADMETQCGASRELLYQACAKVDRGDADNKIQRFVVARSLR